MMAPINSILSIKKEQIHQSIKLLNNPISLFDLIGFILVEVKKGQ